MSICVGEWANGVFHCPVVDPVSEGCNYEHSHTRDGQRLKCALTL